MCMILNDFAALVLYSTSPGSSNELSNLLKTQAERCENMALILNQAYPHEKLDDNIAKSALDAFSNRWSDFIEKGKVELEKYFKTRESDPYVEVFKHNNKRKAAF